MYRAGSGAGAGASALPGSNASAAVGSGTMAKYKQIKLLGKGGFGAAMLVQDRTDQTRLYVVKEVRLSADKKAQEDAKREAAFLKSLRHPNIVGYIESFVEKGMLHIVMDYADGGDLNQRVTALKNARQTMPEEEALSYFVQICLALKHVHDLRILHRDLKSQNVFLTKKGIVKVGDFGIAKALSSSMDMARTQVSRVGGADGT
jgi:NIMA (never in mitosis gene a)-related kinase